VYVPGETEKENFALLLALAPMEVPFIVTEAYGNRSPLSEKTVP
jgi:hypothetical protein